MNFILFYFGFHYLIYHLLKIEMSLKVNIISKLSELKTYKKEWDNLFFSFGKSPFQSFEFIYFWHPWLESNQH